MTLPLWLIWSLAATILVLLAIVISQGSKLLNNDAAIKRYQEAIVSRDQYIAELQTAIHNMEDRGAGTRVVIANQNDKKGKANVSES